MTPRTMNREALRGALDNCGAEVGPGLTDAEFAAVESRYGFRFPPDHRLMLSIGLPLGPDWPNWRAGDEAHLRRLLAFPVEGILLNVEAGHFWWPEWGERSNDGSGARELARGRLSEVPPLVPVHAYVFIGSQPPLPGNPVFSIWETDVIYIGSDLLDHFRRAFVDKTWNLAGLPGAARPVEFWSQLVERRAQRRAQ